MSTILITGATSGIGLEAAVALGAFRPFSQVFDLTSGPNRPRMGRVIPRQCYARIIADVQMHRRSPVRIGFCVSFPVGSVLALGSMISTQAMPGVTVVFLYLAVAWFVLYAACGALPYLAAGAEKRMVAAAFWGFGIGGAAAGELVAILVMSHNLASHARVLGAFAIPATIPWLLGFFMTRWLAAGWA